MPTMSRPHSGSHAPAAELLAAWTSRVRTGSGVEICIRPLRPDDREREIAFINALSDRSRYLRLFTPLKFVPLHLLDQLMDIDYRSRMALVATIDLQGTEQFVGIARYAETDQSDVVELGITVADAWQRCGIARLLVTALMRFARMQGFHRISGIVLPENQPMIALAKSLGFTASYDAADQLLRISRSLEEPHMPG